MGVENIDRCLICPAGKTCVFSHLPEEDRQTLRDISRTITLPRGEELVRQGDAPEGLYIVQTGVVRLYQVTPEGRMEIVQLLGPAGIVGAGETLSGETYPLSAEAVETSRLEHFPRLALEAFLAEHPRAAQALLGWLARELHKTVHEWCESLAKSPLGGRLRTHLHAVGATCGQPTSEGVALSPHLTVQDLGFGLGCSRQWTSKLLGELENEGHILRHGRRVVLPSPPDSSNG